MPYQAEISRSSPGCILLLLDHSLSMEEPCKGASGERSKAEFLADAVSRLIQELILRCSREDGVRNYFDVGVVGYTTDNAGTPQIYAAWESEALQNRVLVPLREVADNPVRVEARKKLIEDGAGGVVEVETKMPVWISPVHVGGTPMRAALEYCRNIVQDWVDQHPNSYPPIVVHVTDGEWTPEEEDPRPAADSIKSIATSDGNVLLYNIHLSGEKGTTAVAYPSDTLQFSNDRLALAMFEMSSELPPQVVEEGRRKGFALTPGARGMLYKAQPQDLVHFFDIGTRTPTLR